MRASGIDPDNSLSCAENTSNTSKHPTATGIVPDLSGAESPIANHTIPRIAGLESPRNSAARSKKMSRIAAK